MEIYIFGHLVVVGGLFVSVMMLRILSTFSFENYLHENFVIKDQ